jgi:hypothetical protein
MIGWLALLLVLAPSSAMAISDRAAYEALVVCQAAIAPYLRAPITAIWPNTGKIEDGAGGSVWVDSWVDSQNAFGAWVRTFYGCDVYGKEATNLRIWPPGTTPRSRTSPGY